MSYRVELSMDKTIQEGYSMSKIIEVTQGERILVEHRMAEVRISEVDTEEILGMITLVEVEVDLEIDSIQVMLGEMREAVVDQDEVQE